MSAFRPPRRVGPPRCVSSNGITLTQVIVTLVVLLVVAILVVPPLAIARISSRQLSDSSQIRDLHRGLSLWAENNDGELPRPSKIDVNNTTVAAASPEEKDTSANIVSVLIFNGYVSPEICVSKSETSRNIRVYKRYQFTSPKTAVASDKKLALWDPAFSADFSKPGGNFSYAHAIPNGAVRSELWAPTWNAQQAVLGNRGPEMSGLQHGKTPDVEVNLRNPNSNTLRIHGGPTTWEGHIAYADNHVNFETNLFARGIVPPYSDSAGLKWEDCLFFDEPDDVEGKNNFLGVFIGAGKELGDFKAIWD